MATSMLAQVLRLLEESKDSLSVGALAHDLGVPVERVEGMIQYWVRKGRIREIAVSKNCGTCGSSGHCPYVIDLPRSYELNPQQNLIKVESLTPGCKSGCGCS